MRKEKSHSSKHIPMIVHVKVNTCIGCPFFIFELAGKLNAHAYCHAPDLTRAIDHDLPNNSLRELKISGKFGSNSIIKCPRPKWCPLNIGDAIITSRKPMNGIMENLNYDLVKNNIKETWDAF